MKRLLLTFLTLSVVFLSFSQENEALQISGYADAYWKYDFSKQENIKTYFANDHNSISLGMIGLGLKKAVGKASFVGELAFGPRGQYLSIANGDDREPNAGNSFHIQNLYASYNFTDQLSMTAGFMGTFVGYEVISPAGNFHYSTSYLFGAGPFQNAGIKANYQFSPKVSAMVGIFNDWNVYRDLNGVSHFGAQITLNPVEGLTAYLNFLTGSSEGGENNYSSGTLFDLVASYSISEHVDLALNAADYTFKSEGGYQGIAIYPKYNINENIAVGLRGEYFRTKDVQEIEGSEVISFTLSGQFKHKGLAVIPEIRLDNDNIAAFLESDGLTTTKKAAQASIAFVYAF
jgi:hypothetical protein